MDPIKPGFKTTEFYISAAAVLIGLIVSSGLVEDTSTVAKILGLMTSALAALGYTAARTLTKAQT